MERPGVGVSNRFTRTIAGKTYVLVGKRRGKHGAGSYAYPGGHIELDEHWLTAAVRETKEEIDVDLTTERFSHWVSITNDVFSPTKHYVTIFVTAELTDEEASRVKNMEPEFCEGWEWIEESKLRGGEAGDIFLPLQNLYGGKASMPV